MKYYTMVEVARLIGIPESTARSYRDRFPSFISTYGQGRTKRYTDRTLEVLRMVAAMSHEGIPFEDIQSALEAHFGVAIEPQDSQDTQQYNAISQSQTMAGMLSPDEMKELFKQAIQEATEPLQKEISLLKFELAEHQIKPDELRSEISALQDKLEKAEQQQQDRSESRDQKLMALIREIQESKKPWRKRIFGK